MPERYSHLNVSFNTMKIDPIHQSVADNYIRNGGNKTQAYLTVKPDVTIGTAQSASCKLFKRDEVVAYLEDKQELITTNSIADRQFLIQEAHEIGLEAREAKKLNTALTAVEVKGKLNNVYDRETDSPADYSKLIQALVIQGDVNIYNDKPDTKTVDVTP